ncbi:hypothetical protein [Nostoc sp. FACHB-110]|uniref:hypothetical protein n=1 Tax=Nostoc sp. FACHB-110 TaxID=2692834 RepID=UPI001685CAB8|nr:hypothetical protein [Nostoc sp. FACHB-110]MBD2441006.1 hypothetical protein [Nostoc sp. FACHB-110]
MKETIKSLQEEAFSKHGEAVAWQLACQAGSFNRKETWRKVINMDTPSLAEKFEHEVWARKIRASLGIKS